MCSRLVFIAVTFASFIIIPKGKLAEILISARATIRQHIKITTKVEVNSGGYLPGHEVGQ